MLDPMLYAVGMNPMPTTPPSPCKRRTWHTLMFSFVCVAGLAACGGDGSAGAPPAPQPPVPPAPTTQPKTTALGVQLTNPWGMAFLPDGRMLVTQKGGSLVIVRADGSAIDATVNGVPAVNNSGQGGLLDVAIDPDFATSPWVYLSFSESDFAGSGTTGTALARGRLVGNSLLDVAVIWRQTPKVTSSSHFGSRIVFRADRTIYLTLGDRSMDAPESPSTTWSQDVAKSIGKVMRLNRDGTPAAGNPSLGATAVPGIWSTGHRNAQGAAIKPGTDELWLTEHGPQGGDELNRVLPGLNYGWPIKSYGCPYGAPIGDACRVGGGTHAPTFEEPKSFWGPTSIAPSNMIFYTGDKFPEWNGNVLVGSMATPSLWRITVDASNNVSAREEISVVKNLGERIRNVEQGPDGWIYLLTDSGRLIRLER
jgi:glucose/arabinose dehydrogenase